MKSEIREQLRQVINQLSNLEDHTVSEIKEIALELYNKAVLLEFLESSEAEKPVKNEPELLDTVEKTPEIFISETEESKSIETIDENLQSTEIHSEPEPLTPEPVYKSALNELEQFAAEFQNMPEFERKTPQAESVSTPEFSFHEAEKQPEISESEESKQPLSKKFAGHKPKSLNDSINRGLAIGLNDRLAFVNQLFEGEIEDYTRVISQINTLRSFEEAKNFIENQVKPDYNEWHNKEEVSGRFMMIIEKTFS